MPDSGSTYLKMDQRPFRYQIIDGEFDGLLYAGWDLGSEEAFNAGLAELEEKGVTYEKVEDVDTLAIAAEHRMNNEVSQRRMLE